MQSFVNIKHEFKNMYIWEFEEVNCSKHWTLDTLEQQMQRNEDKKLLDE